jgi:ankyrin repeat protein
MIATSTRHVAIVGQLLAAGASVHTEDKMGRTALFGAAFSGHVGLTRLLIKDRGANVRHADHRGVTPLFVAILG